MFGLTFKPLGKAKLVKKRNPRRLIVKNMSDSGKDGVLIYPNEKKPNKLHLKLEPVNLSAKNSYFTTNLIGELVQNGRTANQTKNVNTRPMAMSTQGLLSTIR